MTNDKKYSIKISIHLNLVYVYLFLSKQLKETQNKNLLGIQPKIKIKVLKFNKKGAMQDNIEKRILFYWSKLYYSGI